MKLIYCFIPAAIFFASCSSQQSATSNSCVVVVDEQPEHAPPSGGESETEAVEEEALAARVEETPPANEPEDQYDVDTDTWTIYAALDLDWLAADVAEFEDLVRYTKVVFDRYGNPLGIQMEAPEERKHPLAKFGWQEYDIIKSINDHRINSPSDLRRTLRSQMNDEVNEFKFGYERDGYLLVKTIVIKAR